MSVSVAEVKPVYKNWESGPVNIIFKSSDPLDSQDTERFDTLDQAIKDKSFKEILWVAFPLLSVPICSLLTILVSSKTEGEFAGLIMVLGVGTVVSFPFMAISEFSRNHERCQALLDYKEALSQGISIAEK